MCRYGYLVPEPAHLDTLRVGPRYLHLGGFQILQISPWEPKIRIALSDPRGWSVSLVFGAVTASMLVLTLVSVLSKICLALRHICLSCWRAWHWCACVSLVTRRILLWDFVLQKSQESLMLEQGLFFALFVFTTVVRAWQKKGTVNLLWPPQGGGVLPKIHTAWNYWVQKHF